MVDSELRTLNSELKSQGEIKMDKYSELRTTNYELRTKEIMTPREAAEYLSVHVRTIYRLAKNGDIPGRKVGGSWRFKKDTLDEWLSWKENPSSNVKG
jgi:excisionase family DNA binding protein